MALLLITFLSGTETLLFPAKLIMALGLMDLPNQREYFVRDKALSRHELMAPTTSETQQIVILKTIWWCHKLGRDWQRVIKQGPASFGEFQSQEIKRDSG
jgi:hypothetical protein